ncbi:MAG: transposase [Bryobacteraceae bacterium]|nr:transposase [Bryobacteraceae bacterium]
MPAEITDGKDGLLGKVYSQCRHAAHSYAHANAFAERWVRSVKSECLSKLILFVEASLRRALTNFCEHYHADRPHQGKGNVLLFPTPNLSQNGDGRVLCKQRLGGLLRYYCRAA